MEILNKKQSTDGYKNGRFGNHLRQWDDPSEAVRQGGLRTKYALRYRGPGAGGPCVFGLHFDRLVLAWQLHLLSHPRHHLYVSEMAPDHLLTFQGEIAELPHVGGYALHYSTRKVPQREALKDGQHHLGPGALLLCKQFMDHDSYDDLRTLLDLYPLHTVEFSCFSPRLGNLKRNTIFWEVRKF